MDGCWCRMDEKLAGSSRVEGALSGRLRTALVDMIASEL